MITEIKMRIGNSYPLGAPVTAVEQSPAAINDGKADG